jgi:hypothetical protein
MRTRISAVVGCVAVAAVALGLGGCSASSSRRAHERYNDIVGIEEKGRRLDLNSASRKQLAALPGLTDADADRIVQNRPYGSTRGLVNRNVIGERQYEQIEDRIYVSRKQGGQTSGRGREDY